MKEWSGIINGAGLDPMTEMLYLPAVLATTLSLCTLIFLQNYIVSDAWVSSCDVLPLFLAATKHFLLRPGLFRY